MPFKFSSPAEAFQSQKFYTDSKNKAFFVSILSLAKTNSFQGTVCVKSKADGEKVVWKIRDPILQMLHD